MRPYALLPFSLADVYGHDEADGTAALSKQQSRQAACRHHGRPLCQKSGVLHQLKETGSLRFLLEVDGSCNRNTYRALLGAGAQILVMGSSGLFRADMPLELAWETMSRELSAALHSPELV